MTNKPVIHVRAKRRKDRPQAGVIEKMMNQPNIIRDIERRMESYFQAILEGKSEREAQIAAGLDPDRPPVTYGNR